MVTQPLRPCPPTTFAYVLCIHGNFLIAPLGLLNGFNIRACHVIFARRQCGDILRRYVQFGIAANLHTATLLSKGQWHSDAILSMIIFDFLYMITAAPRYSY